jgi:cellulose synthase/poly-beta-1,6-N-acetylglucosamine synthase-like glycosyltransferase
MLAFLAIGCLVLWGLLVPAYPLWLQVFRSARRQPTVRVPAEWPPVDVLVAVQNEACYIEGKIRDLQQLEYPIEQLRFWIIDGTSKDDTVRIAKECLRDDPRFTILHCSIGNKVAQLNEGLRMCRGKWILVTDADARLGSDTLKRMVSAGESDETVATLGTPVQQIDAFPFDQMHWQIADRLRLQESEFGFASIVTGPCYLFRRDLFPCFNADVFADDIFAAFVAASKGKRVQYVSTSVQEIRVPGDLSNFFLHKKRKAHNYLIEIFRTLPDIFRMEPPTRWIFIARALQMTLAPLFGFIGLLGLGTWVAQFRMPHLPLGLWGGLLAAVLVLGWFGRQRILVIALGAMMSAVLLVTFLSYPFDYRRRILQSWRLPGQKKPEKPPVDTPPTNS